MITIRAYVISVFLTALFLIAGEATYAQIKVDNKEYTKQECLDMAALSEANGQIRQAANFLDQLAFYVWENEKAYNEAIGYFQRSIDLNRQINNDNGIMGIYTNMALIYNDKADYERAVEYFKKTIEYRKQRRDKVRLMSTYRNLSVSLDNLKQYDESIFYLEQAATLSIELGETQQTQNIYLNLAEVYEKKGDHKKFLDYFDMYRALQVNYDEQAQVEARRVKAELERSAIELKSAEIEKRNKELELELRNRELKDKEKRLVTQERKLEEADSVYNAWVEKATTAELALKFKEKDEQIKENRLKVERSVRWVIILILLAVGTVALSLYLSYRKNKKYNTLLVEQNKQITEQKIKLERENKIRTKLLSIISHDLRTPMASVHMMVQILRDDLLDPEKKKDILLRLDASLSQTFSLLDNMLYWAKSQINGIKPAPVLLDLGELASDIINAVSTMLETKQLTIENEIEKGFYVFADKDITNIVMRNLTANAIKYTPIGGTITYSAKRYKDQIVVSVADTGIGMDEKQKADLFTNNVVSQQGTKSESGSGLGLVLSRDFVEMSGGKMWFTSEKDKGSIFYFTLPISPEEKENLSLESYAGEVANQMNIKSGKRRKS